MKRGGPEEGEGLCDGSASQTEKGVSVRRCGQTRQGPVRTIDHSLKGRGALVVVCLQAVVSNGESDQVGNALCSKIQLELRSNTAVVLAAIHLRGYIRIMLERRTAEADMHSGARRWI